MDPLTLVNLNPLINRTRGAPEIIIGLLDGPVLLNHPQLSENIREIPARRSGRCTRADSASCTHGTFVAGILSAKRGSKAPAICPGCTLLVRPIFDEHANGNGRIPTATPEELAAALVECVNAGVRVLNLSVALARLSTTGQRELEEALDYVARKGAIVVVAAGNQGTVGSTVLTRHPWVLPVIACDYRGRPTGMSNLGSSIGKRGLSAPGDAITSLGPNGQSLTFGGTSIAAPFVTGTLALLWSEFPQATGAQIKFAITNFSPPRRATVVPPLLNAWAAYQALSGAS